jgi:hypothetical protein
MTYARTIAAIATATFAFVLVPQIEGNASAESTFSPVVETRVAGPVAPLPEVDDTDIIDGVKLIADTGERTDFFVAALDKFAAAGWPITNTEIRFDEDECVGAVGFHAEEKGHHVIVMCTDAEWTLLHELGHVWSDLYLSEDQRAEWVERRGVDSWHEGDWQDRGTEHAADIIAFGLFDTTHVPTTIGNNDYGTLVENFDWLFGMAPLHRNKVERAVSHENHTRVEVVPSRQIVPAEASATNVEVAEPVAPSEYNFPIACGFPRWHSSHGGYGYVDPRDWTHVGVDLYAFEGTPVVSPVHGTVVDAGWGDISGWKVVVEDRFGYQHRLIHLSQPARAATGMTVHAGQDLGAVGRSGNASGGGPHLHYEIRMDGEPIDPMPWLNATGGGNVDRAPSSFYSNAAPAMAACEAKA